MKHGVVTLLDVLGWKGIWQRYGGDEAQPIRKLLALVEMAKQFLEHYEKNQGSQNYFSCTCYCKVICLSDTVIMTTWADENDKGFIERTLEFHAQVCASLIRYSIIAGIPFRGATTAGKFIIEGDSFIGPAIDEVAQWYELADWIGVIFTPSAKMLYTNKFGHGKLYDVPLKNGVYNTICVNWPLGAWLHNRWNGLVWNNDILDNIDSEPKDKEALKGGGLI